jgi:hypothetical protein
MGNIIRLPDGRRHEAQLLLPWYLTGQLDADEAARVEAHLDACPECQAELELERRLQAGVAGLPIEAEHAWAGMLHKLRNPPRPPAAAFGAWLSALAGRTLATSRAAAPWLGWAAAAGLGMFVLASAPAPAPGPAASYHALSALPAAARPAGNMVVIFRPDATEQSIRRALRDAGARLVDGPTAADAYVLQVAPAARERALSSLRARRAVVLAEAVDPGGSP